MKDFIPVLSLGAHDNPSEGACIMEMVSFMSGDEWTDYPKCSNENISRIAQMVNDRLKDEDRHLILSQFNRLFNTSDVSFRDMNEALMPYATELFENHTFEGDSRGVAKKEAKYWLNARMSVQTIGCILLDNYYNNRTNAESLVKLLSDVLDIYDEISDRQKVEEHDLSMLAEHPSQVGANV